MKVFYSSLLFIVLFLGIGFFSPEEFSAVTSQIFTLITNDWGWLYLVVVLGILIFVVYLAFSPFGKVRLGKDEDRPEYSNFSWFAMLFSAGMGIGLVFWGVAEPAFHFSSPPIGIEAYSLDAAAASFRYVFLHWGFHPWAVYAIVGLSLAYVTYRKDMPCLISSIVKPIMAEKPFKIAGGVIDTLALLITVFGVATSLGMGALQVAGGLSSLFNFSNTFLVQVVIILVITVMFLISATTGLNKGIRILSNSNIIIALSLLAFVFIFGPTAFIIKLFFNTLGGYLNSFLTLSLPLDPFVKDPWVGDWTIFYWAWWVSWGPFVGTFIARVSKGRTIKEFVLGVLIVPAGFCFIWFSVFGGTALYHEIFQNIDIVSAVSSDVAVGLFVTLANLPFGSLISLIAIVLITTFFVTSADSATFVLGMYSQNGKLNPDNWIKIVWGVTLSLMAILLLNSGGLEAMRNTSIMMALPFLLVLIVICVAIAKELNDEQKNKLSE
ncbi:MAG: glycine betaine transporter [Eubacteriaceae bacterium]|jgi:glycine betaine transporter|nr:glycine betaine transporter [Eubacteriaceae bacterium]MDK2935121.1 glycine betaine transporter [Eubacteriaceae bacterium]MDK2961672.1 glycine betaine transporter [Eubacteriaceae bacterium]MDN5307600.1 glycine betaine transporter [Eubacteriaceae bacterium]